MYESQKRASEKYQKQNIKRFTLKLNKRTDADMIRWLEGKDNIQGYIKHLIKLDMEINEAYKIASNVSDGIQAFTDSVSEGITQSAKAVEQLKDDIVEVFNKNFN